MIYGVQCHCPGQYVNGGMVIIVQGFWGNLFCTNGKVTLGQKKEMIGNGMTSEGQIFSQQEMSVAIKKMKENKAADESGVIAEYLKEYLKK